jgi:hypothetical protein
MFAYVVLCSKLVAMQTNSKTTSKRCDKPHPINLKELKTPLLQVCIKEDRSIPYLVRKAVKEWLQNNYPEKLV